MRERDYVWCVANLLLDREEELDALCPACRARVEGPGLPGVRRPQGGRRGRGESQLR